MTTEDIKTLFAKAYDYASAKFGSKPDYVRIEEAGTITVSWSKYVGCGDWEDTFETITVEEIN